MTGLQGYKGTTFIADGKKEHTNNLKTHKKIPHVRIFLYIMMYLLTTNLRSLNKCICGGNQIKAE